MRRHVPLPRLRCPLRLRHGAGRRGEWRTIYELTFCFPSSPSTMSTRAFASISTLLLLLAASGTTPTGQAGPEGPPYTPEQSRAMIRLEPGFRVELVASEPDVQSPV